MANILLVGKDLPESTNLVRGLELQGHTIFSSANPESEINIESPNIFSYSWKRASTISAKTLYNYIENQNIDFIDAKSLKREHKYHYRVKQKGKRQNGKSIDEIGLENYQDIISVLFQDTNPMAFTLEENVSSQSLENTDNLTYVSHAIRK